MRHGQSTWNHEHRIQGQLDPPLSQDGRRQATRLGRRLAGRPLAGFYSSDLKRAFETAQLICDQMGASIPPRQLTEAADIEPKPMPELREIYLGDWEGLKSADIAERYPEAWANWQKEPSWDLVPRGEPAALFEARVAAAMESIFNRHEQGEVLIVTHGGVIQVALHRIVGRSSHGLFAFKIQNASISVIEKGNGRLRTAAAARLGPNDFFVSGVNDIAHLESGSEVRADGLG